MTLLDFKFKKMVENFKNCSRIFSLFLSILIFFFVSVARRLTLSVSSTLSGAPLLLALWGCLLLPPSASSSPSARSLLWRSVQLDSVGLS